MSNIPASHIDEANKLEADGIVELFQIDMTNTSSLYLKSESTALWNGQTWEGLAIALSGVGSYGDDQISKPKLSLTNPDAIFSPFVSQGEFDAAFVTRYRVLYDDLVNDRPIYINQVWQINRVAALTRSMVSLELRSLTDVPNFIIPARTYTPPKFPVVSISQV